MVEIGITMYFIATFVKGLDILKKKTNFRKNGDGAVCAKSAGNPLTSECYSVSHYVHYVPLSRLKTNYMVNSVKLELNRLKDMTGHGY